jgi:hypothetical protein
VTSRSRPSAARSIPRGGRQELGIVADCPDFPGHLWICEICGGSPSSSASRLPITEAGKCVTRGPAGLPDFRYLKPRLGNAPRCQHTHIGAKHLDGVRWQQTPPSPFAPYHLRPAPKLVLSWPRFSWRWVDCRSGEFTSPPAPLAAARDSGVNPPLHSANRLIFSGETADNRSGEVCHQGPAGLPDFRYLKPRLSSTPRC